MVNGQIVLSLFVKQNGDSHEEDNPVAKSGIDSIGRHSLCGNNGTCGKGAASHDCRTGSHDCRTSCCDTSKNTCRLRRHVKAG